MAGGLGDHTSICWPAGWIVVDLFGLQCYNRPEQLLLIVVSLSAPSGWRRSRWRGLPAIIGLSSTQDYPVVTAGLGVAAFALNNRQPS